MRGLRRINAVINTKTFEIKYIKRHNETPEQLLVMISEEVESHYKKIINRLMKRNNEVGELPFKTKV